MIEQSRRGFITGLISLVAAPAIVRAGSLMPVKQMLVPVELGTNFIVICPEQYAELLKARVNFAYELMHRGIIANMDRQLYNSTEPSLLFGAAFE